MLNSIYEERQRQQNHYHVSLTINRGEYTSIYGNDFSVNNAQSIINQYLQYKGDDGDVMNVQLFDYPDSDIINIEADLNYLGNEYKSEITRNNNLQSNASMDNAYQSYSIGDFYK